MHGITQRSNVQEGSISNSRTSPPILAPKLLALRRARSWNNLVRRVSPTRIQLLPLVRSSEFIAAENRPWPHQARQASCTISTYTHTHTLYARARLAISKRNSRLPCLSLSAALSNRAADKAGPWLMDEWWRKKRVDKIIAAISSTKMRQWSLDGRKLLLYTDCDAGIRA